VESIRLGVRHGDHNNGLITINVGTGRGYVFCPDGTECPDGQTAEFKTRKIQAGRFPVYRPRWPALVEAHAGRVWKPGACTLARAT